MNQTNAVANKTGWILCVIMGSLLVWMLAGCVHRREARYRGGSYAARPSVAVGVSIRSDDDFYEPLSPYGRWEVVGSYGRCWIPGRVETGWRPYSNGSWERTDAGWYWASDEPWGWATYHYGRWDLSPSFGWYWVPQTVWAPAWVSWHGGGGYVGWAPLSPSGRIDVRVISPRIVFVEQRHFLDPVRRTTVVVNNTTIINKTVINRGPQTAVIERVTGHKIRPVQVRELRRKEEAAVVARQPANDRNTQAPARADVERRDKKANPARESRQVERLAATTTESQRPVTKKDTRQADEHAREAKFNEQKQAQQEKARTAENERGKRTIEQRAEKSEPKAQPAPEQHGKHEQADNEQSRKDAKKEDHKEKGEEQPAENPDVSPQSSQ